MSDRDIYTGQRWRKEIADHLRDIKVGIVCVTPENVERPWLNFEAGALSRQVNNDERVCCYCFGLKPTDFEDPLGDFNGVEATPEGTWKLLRSINASLEGPRVEEPALRELFDAMWPKLEAALKAIPSTVPEAPPKREKDDMVEEILSRVRQLERGIDEIAYAVDGFPVIETPLGGPQGPTGAVGVSRFWPRSTYVLTGVTGATGPSGPTGFQSTLGVFKKVDPDPEKP
jgi:hypothetical protein